MFSLFRSATRLGYICGAIFLMFAGDALHAQTTVMVSNLGETNNGTTLVRRLWDRRYLILNDAAGSFTTGSTATLLDNITLSIASGTGSGFTLQLYSNTTDQPGTLITTLVGSASPTSAGQYSYLTAQTINLSANTTYWWVASIGGGNVNYNFYLVSTSSTNQTSSVGWTIGDTALQRTNNGSWTTSASPVNFSVSSVSAIPEPGTYAALAGAAALGFVMWRRRRA